MNLFVLTPEEKRVVAFIMLMILLGVAVKEYRRRHPVAPISAQMQKHPSMRKLPPLPSATTSPSARPKRARKPRKKASVPDVPEQEAPDSAPSAADSGPPH